jgi:hypothetical protein
LQYSYVGIVLDYRPKGTRFNPNVSTTLG